MPSDLSRTMSFLFARLHFPDLFGQDAHQRIFENLVKMQEIKEEKGNYYWAFGDIGHYKNEDAEFIYGRLGKSIKTRFEIVYDDKNHSFSRESVNVQKANYGNFFIMPSSNIIAYEDSANISKMQFQKQFSKIWFLTSQTKIEFEFILRESEVFDIIKTWDRLTKATFKLFPTNPSSREDFKPLDILIRKTRAERAKMDFENETEGLNAEEDTAVTQGVSMASAGYGFFDLRGMKGSVGQRASSKGMEIRRDLVRIDDLESLSPEMMKEIRKIVKAMNSK